MDAEKLKIGSPKRSEHFRPVYSNIFPESKFQLQQWLGSTGLESIRGKSVLDVGCGMGQNPYWFAKEGAESVTAVDVDEQSLAGARRNLASLPNAKVLTCSVYDLDPKNFGSFDVVTCIGVLHHLATPQEALEKMWSCVKPGGKLLLWCYGKEGNQALLPLIQSLRFVGSRLPLPATHGIAKTLALIAWPTFHYVPWKTTYYKNLRKISFKNLEHIIFDQIIPRIAHYWSREDLNLLTAPLKGQAHIELVQGNSWHVRVTKNN